MDGRKGQDRCKHTETLGNLLSLIIEPYLSYSWSPKEVSYFIGIGKQGAGGNSGIELSGSVNQAEGQKECLGGRA